MISLAEPLRYVTVKDPYGPCGDGRTDDKVTDSLQSKMMSPRKLCLRILTLSFTPYTCSLFAHALSCQSLVHSNFDRTLSHPQPFLHKYAGKYYLSWGCFYAMADSVYGPYQTQGSVISTDKITPAFRMNDTGAIIDTHVSPQSLRTRRHLSDIWQQQQAGQPDRQQQEPAPPAEGSSLMLWHCESAPTSNINFDLLPASTNGSLFTARLASDHSLCVTTGRPLVLQKCEQGHKGQVCTVGAPYE